LQTIWLLVINQSVVLHASGTLAGAVNEYIQFARFLGWMEQKFTFYSNFVADHPNTASKFHPF
jgi:hypothetical protein